MTTLQNKILSFLVKNKFQLLLIGLILLCLYPLSLFIYIPKWDNVNGYLPYRFFISDYIHNGHLPLWNPFQRLGVPGYSDLQSGCWNPIVWVIILFGKYTIKSLIIELLTCYVFAGLGMYKLAKYFYNCQKTSFIIGFSYALSGFMVGSSQLMVFLIAVTWFPWIIYHLLLFFKTYSIKHILLISFFLALFITGASPAYTIILAYIVVGMFIYHLIISRRAILDLKKITIGGFSILAILILLILPYINSFIDFSPYFNRIDKLEYNTFLLANPFTPVSYISFLYPYSVIAKTELFNITDLSLRNGYFGLVGFVCFIFAFLSKFNRQKIILTVCLFTSLLLAAGDETFIFKFLYNLPGFGVFRHPSIFRAFTIFCALLLAGVELKNILQNGLTKKQKLVGAILLIFILVSTAYSFARTSFNESYALLQNTFHFLEFSESTFATHLFVNGILTLSLIYFIYMAKRILRLSFFVSLLAFVILDIGLQTRLTFPTTISYKIFQQEVSNFFSSLPNDISQDYNYTPLKNLDEAQGLKSTNGIWQNLSTFNKTISYVGVNPLRFKAFDKAKNDGRLDLEIEKNILHFENENNAQVNNIFIDYNKFSGEINNSSDKGKKLVLAQNYHHLWKATINNSPLTINPYNNFLMSVSIPPKTKGKIEFEYKSPTILYTFMISLFTYLLVIGYLVKERLFNSK